MDLNGKCKVMFSVVLSIPAAPSYSCDTRFSVYCLMCFSKLLLTIKPDASNNYFKIPQLVTEDFNKSDDSQRRIAFNFMQTTFAIEHCHNWNSNYHIATIGIPIATLPQLES
ncbi:hypothetical protein CEXT_790661 [Caerostris extrusa]|uniref:Uncharacterized protein n=1 Tax=Caerostris extrusa TaxID=172846 RepID=A0AAV4VW02_CAEEX|nr:hypothetical protein CEXT_790661 [Caerostris extrusa]